MNNIWIPYDQQTHRNIPDSLVPWLLHKGSFMQRLQESGVMASVQVLSQAWQVPWVSENQALGITTRARSLIREVFIHTENNLWMYARTIFPRAVLRGKWEQLAHLQNRSLGSLLFSDPDVKRSEFQIACLKPGMFWYKKIVQHRSWESSEIWARQSKFEINQHALLLTEVFLPSLNQLIEEIK